MVELRAIPVLLGLGATLAKVLLRCSVLGLNHCMLFQGSQITSCVKGLRDYLPRSIFLLSCGDSAVGSHRRPVERPRMAFGVASSLEAELNTQRAGGRQLERLQPGEQRPTEGGLASSAFGVLARELFGPYWATSTDCLKIHLVYKEDNCMKSST